MLKKKLNILTKFVIIFLPLFFCFSYNIGKVISDNIPIQSSTFANGFYPYIDGLLLATGHHHISYSSVRHSLLQVGTYQNTSLSILFWYVESIILLFFISIQTTINNTTWYFDRSKSYIKLLRISCNHLLHESYCVKKYVTDTILV